MQHQQQHPRQQSHSLARTQGEIFTGNNQQSQRVPSRQTSSRSRSQIGVRSGANTQSVSQSRADRLPTLGSHTSTLSVVDCTSKSDMLNQSVGIVETQEKPFAQLQRKARASFKKLLKTDGKLDRQVFSFFYVTNTVAASQGLHFKRISELKQGMNEFRTSWLSFNQPLQQVPQYPNQPIKPTVLVIADEIFTMGDRQLYNSARLSVPNTLKESTMIRDNNRDNPHWHNPASLFGGNAMRLVERDQSGPTPSFCQKGPAGFKDPLQAQVQRGELFRQQTQWQNTNHVVQGHLFDGKLEPQDVTVFDYLMKFGHDIISFKMCERLQDCWLSQRVEWHVERGLKINMDGSACLQGRPVSKVQIQQLQPLQRKSQAKECKMQAFCVSCFRPGTLTAHMASVGSASSKHTFAHECHFFSMNTVQQQQNLKMNLGPGVYVGKYDIPCINIRAPLGTSIFQLQKEREFAEQNQRLLNKKYLENLTKQSKKLTPAEKRPPVIEEPKPGPTHLVCAVCREQFTNYYQHIFSQRHKRGVIANNSLFTQIDSTIKDIAKQQARKHEEAIQALLKRSAQKFQDGQSLKHLREMINPEDATKNGIVCVNTEDTSSGSAAQNKITAATTEHSNAVENIKDSASGHHQSVQSPTGKPQLTQSQLLFNQSDNSSQQLQQRQCKQIETIDLDGCEASKPSHYQQQLPVIKIQSSAGKKRSSGQPTTDMIDPKQVKQRKIKLHQDLMHAALNENSSEASKKVSDQQVATSSTSNMTLIRLDSHSQSAHRRREVKDREKKALQVYNATRDASQHTLLPAMASSQQHLAPATQTVEEVVDAEQPEMSSQGRRQRQSAGAQPHSRAVVNVGAPTMRTRRAARDLASQHNPQGNANLSVYGVLGATAPNMQNHATQLAGGVHKDQ